MSYLFYDNWNWPYDEALQWMRVAKARCINDGEMAIGVGAHSQDLVTLGRHTSDKDILDADRLKLQGVPIFRVDRGGGATLHGPGQIVAYPIISLTRIQQSVPQFTSTCEQAMTKCLNEFGLDARTILGQPGIFIGDAKIGSVGFHISQGCVTHGISLNVHNNLSLYGAITPCGVANASICSMKSLLGYAPELQSVGIRLRQLLADAARGSNSLNI